MPLAQQVTAMTNDALPSSFREDRDPDPDAQGQAALLLIESLIHSLMESGALTKAQAADAIRSAMDVKVESATEEKEPRRTLQKSVTLLANMLRSVEAHSEHGDTRNHSD